MKTSVEHSIYFYLNFLVLPVNKPSCLTVRPCYSPTIPSWQA